jgi:hypothetical protein
MKTTSLLQFGISLTALIILAGCGGGGDSRPVCLTPKSDSLIFPFPPSGLLLARIRELISLSRHKLTPKQSDPTEFCSGK